MIGPLARERILLWRDPAVALLLAGSAAAGAVAGLWVVLAFARTAGASASPSARLWAIELVLASFAVPWAVSRRMDRSRGEAFARSSVGTSWPVWRLVAARSTAALLLGVALVLAALPVAVLVWTMDATTELSRLAAAWLLLAGHAAVLSLVTVLWNLVLHRLPAFLASLATAAVLAVSYGALLRERVGAGLIVAAVLLALAGLELRRQALGRLVHLPR